MIKDKESVNNKSKMRRVFCVRQGDRLINKSSYSTFERSLESIGRENYIKDEHFKDRAVLVGSLRNY